MSVAKEAWVEILARKQLMWHGTSARYLRSILKEGLKASPSNSNYDWRPYSESLSLESHGGVYLARSISRAASYAGANALLIGVQVEDTGPDVLTDEDQVQSYLLWAMRLSSWVGSLRENLRRTPKSLEEAREMADEYALSIPPEDFIAVVEKFVPGYGERLKRSTELGRIVVENYRSLAAYYITAWWARSVEKTPTSPEPYRAWVKDFKRLSKGLKSLIPQHSTLRIDANIGFSGATKIVFIGSVENSGAGKKVEVVYSKSEEARNLFERFYNIQRESPDSTNSPP